MTSKSEGKTGIKMLAIHDLSFSYSTKPILRQINFSTHAGMICGLLGPNASGKTTLLKCISGVLKPDRGNVFIDDIPVARFSRKAIAGMMAVVPQLVSVAFSFTALQMVVMARLPHLKAFSAPSGKDYHKAENLMAEIGLDHLANRVFNELSGGEKQMTLLARALFQNPRILLLDEPTAHLDFKNQHMILHRVEQITKRRNLTTLVTLHDPNLAARYCPRMVMLKHGQVYQKGTIEDVFEEGTLESIYGLKVFIENSRHGQCFIMPSMDMRKF